MNDEQQLSPEFYEILDTCIDAVLSGRQTIQQCLDSYPQVAALLKPDLQAAVMASRLKAPRMSSDKVTALEAALRQEMARPAAHMPRQRAQSIVPLPFMRLSRRAAAVVIVMLAFIFGGGGSVVYASSDSLPGDSLYSVKRLWEGVIVIAASIIGQMDDVSLQLAETRYEEVQALATRGDVVPERVLEDLESAAQEAIQHTTAETDTQLEVLLVEIEQSITADSIPVEDTTVLATLAEVVDQGLIIVNLPEIPPDVEITPEATVPDVETTIEPTAPDAEITTEATVQIEPIVTLEPTPTETLLPIETETPTLEPTNTPRIPNTPTRTPTPTATIPTETPTPTATHTPTITWTPLIPTQGVILPGETRIIPTLIPQITPDFTAIPTWYPWTQATVDAFYLTRTAEPPVTEEPASDVPESTSEAGE